MADANPNQKMTMFANRAVITATAISSAFANRTFGTAVKRKLRVDEPEGPSTGGGKKARQPLSLIPVQGASPALVCGWIDVVTNEAELRSFGSLASRYFARHKLMPDIAEPEYNGFIDELRKTLTTVGITKIEMAHEEPPAEVAMAAGAAPVTAGGGSKNIAMIAIAAVAIAVIIGALFAL